MHVRAAPSSNHWTSLRGIGLFDRRRRPRLALLLGIVAAHLLVIVWLITRPPATPVAERAGTVLALSAFAQEQPPSPPKQPPAPRQLPKPLLSMPSTQPVETEPVASPSEAAPGVAGQCQLTLDTQAAIERDPAAMAELAALPPGLRTEADAVMVWNGQWVDLAAPVATGSKEVVTDPGSGAPAVPSAIGSAIAAVVEAASPACRDGLVAGPVFIPIPEPGRTTILVIGSGAWRWSDMLQPGKPCVASPSATCAADPVIR